MADQHDHVLVVISEPHVSILLDRIIRSAGYTVTVYQDGNSALKQARLMNASLVILGERLRDGSGMNFAAEFGRSLPTLPVVMYLEQESPELVKQILRLGVYDYICSPLKSEDVIQAIHRALDLVQRRKDAFSLETRRLTSSLQRQADEMEMLTRLGRQMIGSLDLDSVLASIVDAAVKLTGAEEGSLLLIEGATGELFMRASRNFQEDFVRTFRLPISDSLAGSVIRSGQAILIDESTPQKIKTSYLVQSLLYVPLQWQGRVLGVLGVDNRHSHLPLTQRHVTLVNTLASYAVIALENARLYADVNAERNKLETILKGIQDGVMVIDQEQRLRMINPAAQDALGMPGSGDGIGKPFKDAIKREELIQLVATRENSLSNHTEISPDQERVYSAQVTPIPGVGQVVMLHDITYLKKLDQIKTDFVHTISHDLRSPLTAILGYVELIERAGPVTDMQRDFIRRVQVSVHNMTHLVDNLLDLGRIESGFDGGKEAVRLDQMIHYSAEGLKKLIIAKSQHLQIIIPDNFPAIQANAVQMRQMVDHLLDNAIKYTPADGTIQVTGATEEGQVIIQFRDSGIGIPTMDLPYIFEKFYRASNASAEIPGTGLGLAIVKSIVDNHGGRVWVESTVGKGSCFTIVLPCSPSVSQINA